MCLLPYVKKTPRLGRVESFESGKAWRLRSLLELIRYLQHRVFRNTKPKQISQHGSPRGSRRACKYDTAQLFQTRADHPLGRIYRVQGKG
jgi:hypothetical protein